jgi:hypothetical protein
MNYPRAVLEKAKRLEQLLHRVAAGESLAEVNEALGFDLDQEQLTRAQTRYESGGRTLEALIDGRFGHPQKIHSGIREWLYARKEKDKDKFEVEVDPGHINYLLRKRGLTAPPGRPYKEKPVDAEAADVVTTPSESIDNAGIFFPGGSEDRDGGGGSD